MAMKRVERRIAGPARVQRVRRVLRAPRPTAGARYSVGYGRPPSQHQFQRGQSGNPKGRPKGAKNTSTLLREILDRKVAMRTGGLIRKISVREAILARFAESALKGDFKAAGFLLQRYDMAETGKEYATDGVSADDQEIIDAFLQGYVKRGGERK
jgi:hypothetical protein